MINDPCRTMTFHIFPLLDFEKNFEGNSLVDQLKNKFQQCHTTLQVFYIILHHNFVCRKKKHSNCLIEFLKNMKNFEYLHCVQFRNKIISLFEHLSTLL